jgi:nicotinate-nucleotide pyrophosphorylase (carboxylating)
MGTVQMTGHDDAMRRIVAAALAEDLGQRGDLTTAAIIPVDRDAVGHVVARDELVVAGLTVAREVFRQLDPAVVFLELSREGDWARPGEKLATVTGRARPILEGERTALNFLMRMCGIATVTHRSVDEIAGTGAHILDTRKTAPGLRILDKMAVFIGGGRNHRMGLFDAVMIKDTHLGTGRSVGPAVRAALDAGIPAERITAEVRDLAQLEEAIAAGAGRALLDNMSLEDLRDAVRVGKGRIVLEASGGLRPGTLRPVAETGVDCLSIGWLTHSVTAADVAMEMEGTP